MNELLKGSLLCIFLFSLISVVSAQGIDTYDLNETYSIDTGGTVILESNDANVEITGTNRSDVHLIVHYRAEVKGVSLEGNRGFDMKVSERGGNLVIRERTRYNTGITGSYSIRNREYSIIIEAPEDIHLDIDGDDDEYLLSDISGSITMDLDDADAEFRNCTGREFTFSYDDGTLTADRLQGSLDVQMDDGRFEIGTGDFKTVEVETDDGEITLSTPLYDEGEYRFTMDDGTLNMNLLSGGGTIRIDHDNINLSAPGSFTGLQQDDNSSRFELAGGNALVRIKTDDGTVTLNTE